MRAPVSAAKVRGEARRQESVPIAGDMLPGVRKHSRPPVATDWGDYAPAIARWEDTLGELAPAPTKADGRKGQHRLSADFVEWLMGYPAGHVTDAGISRNAQLKALGNAVVPQQAALALRELLGL